jgi:hypothetical protein
MLCDKNRAHKYSRQSDRSTTHLRKVRSLTRAVQLVYVRGSIPARVSVPLLEFNLSEQCKLAPENLSFHIQ